MFLDRELFSSIIEQTPLISIDLIVKNRDEQILLGKRVNNPAKDYWFVPGGRIYKDETIEAAFQRITQDEIGERYLISDANFLGVYQHFYDNNVFNDNFSTHYIVLAFQLPITNRPLTNNQHTSYQWFTQSELVDHDRVYGYVKDYFNPQKGIRHD